jgi:hypothetical protein
MILRKNVSSSSILRLGFLLLVVASLGNYFLPRVRGLGEARVDLVAGLLYGLTIGTFLVGMWMSRRNHPPRG